MRSPITQETVLGESTQDARAASGSELAAERMKVRDSLRNEHGVKSMFVRVQPLSRILGIPAATIYGAIREGRFFLPHRMIFSAPVVKFDDLVEWCCQPVAFKRANNPEAAVAPAPILSATGERLDVSQSSATKALARDFREAIVAEALAEMKRGEPDELA
jgi:hypothetical protein